LERAPSKIFAVLFIAIGQSPARAGGEAFSEGIVLVPATAHRV